MNNVKQPRLDSDLAPSTGITKWCSVMLGTTRDGLTKFGMLDSYGNINILYATRLLFNFLDLEVRVKTRAMISYCLAVKFVIKL